MHDRNRIRGSGQEFNMSGCGLPAGALRAPATQGYIFVLSTISMFCTSTFAVESRRCIKVSYRP